MSSATTHDILVDGFDAAKQLRSYASHPQHGLHAGMQLAHEVLLRRIARAPVPVLLRLALLRRMRILFCLFEKVTVSLSLRGAAAFGRTMHVLSLQHHIAAMPHLQATTCSCLASASSASITLAMRSSAFLAMFRNGCPHAKTRCAAGLCLAPIPRLCKFEVR